MFDDLSKAPAVFFPLFFGALTVCVLIEGTCPGKCPGFQLAFKHAAENPLNMPFAAVRTFDLQKVGYSKLQLFRISFGVSFSTLLIFAGWIGSHSGLLSEYAELENFAWNPIFYVGCLFLFLHSQMTYERLHNGNQIADIRGLIPCVITRSVIGIYMYKWLCQVEQINNIMDSTNGAIMVWCVRIALFQFVLLDIIRLVVFATKGEKGFFTPQIAKTAMDGKVVFTTKGHNGVTQQMNKAAITPQMDQTANKAKAA